MQFLLHPAALSGLFVELCGTESMLAGLPASKGAPATSQGRKVPHCLSQEDIAERGGLELPSLEEQTRHQLLPEVSLGNAQLVGALGITVPLHKCCLKIELKCDCS